MSFELNYSPPIGTKYNWFPKTLTTSPWTCLFLQEKDQKLVGNNANILLRVDMVNNQYTWEVEVTDFKGEIYKIKGFSNDALRACIIAEESAEREFKKLVPSWVKKALSDGWRPPMIKSR